MKSTFIKKSLCYILSAALLAAYLFVLVRSLDVSDTSEAYRSYYIDRTSETYEPDRD